MKDLKSRKFKYFCTMKHIYSLLFIALLGMFSCTKADLRYFYRLDKAIENQEDYDLYHLNRKDSLTLLYGHADTDSERWEAAYSLENILFYHNLDSCHHYVRSMLSLHGNDIRRQFISESCYAYILYKMDSLDTALKVFRQIDTSEICKEGTTTYYNAGYHIYNELQSSHAEYAKEKQDIVERWWKKDSTNIQCAFYHNEVMREKGARDGTTCLKSCPLNSPNDTARFHYFLAREYMHQGNKDEAMKHFAISAECDIRLSVKAYNALYQLARILFKEGDIERANRYMQLTLKDTNSANFKSRYNDVILSELEIMNILLEQHREQEKLYLVIIMGIALLLIVTIVSLVLQRLYSRRLKISREKLSEVSEIKDRFLAIYMEKCVDYLNKVDQYRSSLRHAVKHEGPEAAIAMLRHPSFADAEFHELLSDFDSAFLSIFPDFVDKVNKHMQPEYHLSMPAKGMLSNELRILALIRMGISKRKKIAKVLNLSATTIWSYHSNLQKHSLHPDTSFDKVIEKL